MNIKLLYKMKNVYGVEETLCCDCYFDEVYFCLRNKYSIKKFNEKENCFYYRSFESIIIICYDIFIFQKKKLKLINSNCILDRHINDIPLCSICLIESFKKINCLHKFV